MKKANSILSILLAVCLCASMLSGVSITTSAVVNWTDPEVQQQIFINTALAYFYKGDAMQYGSYYIASGRRYASGITRGTPNRSPEDATSDDIIYNVCSAFPHDVYFEAFGEHVLTEDMAVPGCALINAVNFDADNVSSDFLTSVLNSTENYCYHGAMAKRAGFDVAVVDVDARKNTASADNIFADVLYYFGPDLDPETGSVITYAVRNEGCSGGNLYTIKNGVATLAKTTGAASYTSTSVTGNVTATINGESVSTYFYLVIDNGKSYYITTDTYTFERNSTINSLTAAEVDRIFAEELQPGDIIAVCSVLNEDGTGADGGHTMTYIGDIDGDGVGEIIHATGAKYNNAGQLMVSGDSSTAGYKRYITQNIYDKASILDPDRNTFFYDTAVNTTDYLTGYDLVEAPSGYSMNNFDGKNGYGLNNSATVCPGSGGNIVIEDWFTKLGPYAGLTSATQKVNPDGTYGVDYFPYRTSLKTTGSFYPGGDRSQLQSGAITYSQFCVLRPLSSSRFKDGDWQTGSNTTKGRYLMGDLCVTKTASLTEKESVSAGEEITYTIEFWNPDTTLMVNNSGSYTVNLTETLPLNAQLVEGSIRCPSGVTGSVDTGNTIVFQDITIGQGERITVSYTVKVSDAVSRGAYVISPEGTVELAGDSSAILNTKGYAHIVGGAALSQTQLDTLMDLTHPYAITDAGSGMDIANQVYQKLGGSPAFPDTNTLLQDLLDIDDWSKKEAAKGFYYKLKLSEYSQLEELMVPGYVGGRRLMTYDEDGIKTTENRLVSFNEKYLEPGDILVCAMTTETSESIRLDESEVYVYLGQTDPNHTYYAHYNASGKYEVVNAPLKDVQVATSNIRYQYSSVLTKAMSYDFFVLLRPTLGADNVLSYVSPVSAADDSAAMAACIGDTEYATLAQALAAAVDGDTVTVLKNIRLDNEEENGSAKAYPFVINQDITLDLNGHTISDEGLAGDGTALKGLLYVNSSAVTIQNGTLRSAGSVAALSCNGTIDVTLKDMNVINSVSRAIRQSSGGSGNIRISGGFYSGGSAVLPTIEIQQSSETATVLLQLKDGVVVHGENNDTVLKMGTNTSAVITEATLTTNAESDHGQLYSGSVSTNALVIDAIPMNSKFVYGRRYLPSGTKAVIGNETYTSLSQAISAAKAGDTIILTADIHTEDESGTKVGSNIAKYPLQLKMDMILDLNGYTIDDTSDTVHIPTGDSHLGAPFRITGGTVEIRNGTIRSAGSVAALSLGESARVTLSNMEVINTTSCGIFISADSSANVTLSDSYCFAAGAAVWARDGSTVVTVQDKTILHSAGAQVLNMYSGTKAYLHKAYLLTNASTYQPQTLYSGTVTAGEGFAYRSAVSYVSRKDVSYDFTYADYYDLDSIYALIGETGYTSLSDAIAAAQPGDVITLVADIYTQNEPGHKVSSNIVKYPLQLNTDLTLDLNGHTIDDTTDTVHIPSGGSHLSAPFRITGGNVVLKNGTIASAGTIAALSIGKDASVCLSNMVLTNSVARAIYVSEQSDCTVDISGTYCFGTKCAVYVGSGSTVMTIGDGSVLHSLADIVVEAGEGACVYLRKATVASDAEDAQSQSLFSGTVMPDSDMGYTHRSSIGYGYLHGNTYTFLCGDFYDLSTTQAIIGENSYGSLSEALNAAQSGDTITLVADIFTENEPGCNLTAEDSAKYPLLIQTDLTLDLNGHIIDDTLGSVHIPEGEAHLKAPFRIVCGNVELKNGTIQSAGTLAVLSVSPFAEVTLTDVTLSGTAPDEIHYCEQTTGIVTAPTCTTEGFTGCGCTLCGDDYVIHRISAIGHNYETVTIAATCTQNGEITRTCSVCGDVMKETIPAVGHSYNGVVVSPTCTEIGYTSYTCSVCNDSYIADEVSANGHRYEGVITLPTCTENGYTTYTCIVCGDVYISDTVEATGHNYESAVTAPTCTEDGYTTYTCSTCGDSYVADVVSATGHSYVDGYCTICGEKDPDYVEIVAPTLTLKYPTLAFEDEIMYNVYFNVDDMTNVVELGLLTFIDRNYEGTIADALEIIPGYIVNADGSYTAHTNGVPAKMLGDAMFFKVYARLSDGSYTYTSVVGYHAVAYANTVLNNSASSANAKALVVAMLNYGAAAQTYFDYKADSLMNANLTATQQALVDAYDGSMVEDVVKADSSKVGVFVMNGGYSDIHPTVSFEGAFSINYYFTPKDTPADGVTFCYWTAEAYNAADVLTPENATGTVKMTSETGVYSTAVEGIAAKQIDETIYIAAVYHSAASGTAFYTPVIAYSLGGYCESLANNGNAFGAATAVYGYYAKAYFN